MAYAPLGLGARVGYLVAGVLIGLCWSVALLGWLNGWRLSSVIGEAQPWSWFRIGKLLLTVLFIPCLESGVGWGMLAGLNALRVRPTLQVLVWAAFWANLHYWYPGNALVVFGAFGVFGCCMVAYWRRSPLDALLMGTIMHCAYNAMCDPVKVLLRWFLA